MYWLIQWTPLCTALFVHSFFSGEGASGRNMNRGVFWQDFHRVEPPRRGVAKTFRTDGTRWLWWDEGEGYDPLRNGAPGGAWEGPMGGSYGERALGKPALGALPHHLNWTPVFSINERVAIYSFANKSLNSSRCSLIYDIVTGRDSIPECVSKENAKSTLPNFRQK